MKSEIWNDIDGYKGKYQVSNLGRVKSLYHVVIRKNGHPMPINEKILKPGVSSNGYFTIVLAKNGNKNTRTIHRLVASHFIENIDNKKEVNHKDGDKLNNRVSNLEWVTPSQNIKHSYDTGLKTILTGKYSHIYGSNNPRSRKVIDIKTGEVFDTIAEASKKVNFTKHHVCNMLNGHRKNITNLKYL